MAVKDWPAKAPESIAMPPDSSIHHAQATGSPASCQYAKLLAGYLDATLDDKMAAAVEAHLNHCTECLVLLRGNHEEREPEAWLQLLRKQASVLGPQITAPLFRRDASTEKKPAVPIDVAGCIEHSPAEESPRPRVSALRYTCIRRLGSGGSGDVWEAWDELLGRAVALKFLKNAAAPLMETHRFMQEATALARLSHPHIVSIHELQNLKGIPVLVMELVPGPTLAQYLQGRPCPPIAAAALLEQLCQAVEHAHRLGVIHRDLKPSNVLLKPIPNAATPNDGDGLELGRWCPKIADFGLAHITDLPTLTLPGQRLGTPSYMAPEQVSANPEKCGTAADIYGLGAILYELLTGRPPFASSDPALTMAMILREDPLPPRALVHDIPRDLETVCLKCLSKEPHRRYRDASALRDDCLAILHNRPISARPESRPRRWLAVARRYPAESTAIIASFALLMTITAAALRNSHLSEKLSGEAREKVKLLEKTQSLQQQKQESVHSKFDELLRTHHNVLQLLGDATNPQPIDPEALRSQIRQSAAQLSTPYIELLDQRIAAGHQLTPSEVRLALDYLDIACRAGANVDFANRIPVLTRLTENLALNTVSPWELLEVKLRLENLNALHALQLGQHLQSGQAHLRMAEIIDQQILTYQPGDPAQIERFHVKTAMLMNAIAAFHAGNHLEPALHASDLTEQATNQLIATDPGNQDWLTLLLQVRLVKSQYLPPADAAKLANDTVEQFQNIRWDSPQNAEKARQLQIQLARLQATSPEE